MKYTDIMRISLLFFFVLALVFSSVAQKNELRAYLDSKQFYAPGIGNYIELQLQFVGRSLNYIGEDNGLKGELMVKLSIVSDTGIVASDAYRLASPLMRDSIIDDFYDIKRFGLKPGEYTLSIELADINSKRDPLKASQTIIIDDLSKAIAISDIQVAEYAFKGDENSVFYKSGYEIIPRLSTFYPKQLSSIPIYLEIYNSQLLEDDVFGLKQTIVNAETGAELQDLTVYSKHNASEVVPLLREIDISLVETGKYILEYTVINKNMRELSKQSYEFERSNDIEINISSTDVILDPSFQASISQDSVGYFLESLIPISGPNEVKNIIAITKTKNEENARKYIQLYWTKTSPDDAYESWMKYKAQVQLVERLYRTNFQQGFETDRGRVYLQYGSPTQIIDREFSANEYPYEIWQYDKIGVFSNKRFVFYNPDLTNNAYRLLHSDMIGELKNPSWPHELNKRNTVKNNADDPNGNIEYGAGRNSRDDFRQY
jgi:GWxTD domain-containing protein